MAVKKKAVSKKAASKVEPKRPLPKPKRKASQAPRRAQPKAKAPKAAKKVKARAVVAAPKLKAKPAQSPQRAAAALPPSKQEVQSTVRLVQSAVRPGLQKRPDATPIGVVSVIDGDRLIEQSTFYSAPGRDEYVRRWEARGYTCRLMPWND